MEHYSALKRKRGKSIYVLIRKHLLKLLSVKTKSQTLYCTSTCVFKSEVTSVFILNVHIISLDSTEKIPLEPGLQTFSVETDSKYFGLCGPYSLFRTT